MALPLLGAFLSTAIGPLVKKALVALGLGTITYAGLDVAFNAAKAEVVNNFGATAADSLSLINLAGVGQAIGIVLGALSARVGMAVLSRIGRVL
jgi:cell division protein FtsX